MHILGALFCTSLWLVALLSGTYCGVSADGGGQAWVASLFLTSLSLALAGSGTLLLCWAGRTPRLRFPGGLLLGCAGLIWLGEGVVAGLLMVLPTLGYAAWQVGKTAVEMRSQTPPHGAAQMPGPASTTQHLAP